MNTIQIPSKSSQQGVALLEALIAVLIFSMGVLAIAGLQGAMIKNTSDAKYRSDAAFIAQQTIGSLWSDPTNLASKAATIVPLVTGSNPVSYSGPLASLPSGNTSIIFPSGTATGEVKVVITWTVPGQSTHNYTTYARILGGA